MNYFRCISLSIVNSYNSIKIFYYYVHMLVLRSSSLFCHAVLLHLFLRGGTFRDDTITVWARRELVSHAAVLSYHVSLLLVAWRDKMERLIGDTFCRWSVMDNISLQLQGNPFFLGLLCIPSGCRSFPKSIICSQSRGRDIIFHLNDKKNLRKRQPSHLKYFRLENL